MVDPFSPDDLIQWKKDSRGEPFWAELREMFANRVSGLRAAVRSGNHHEAALRSGELDLIEEVLQLPDVIIQEQKSAADDKEKEGK